MSFGDIKGQEGAVLFLKGALENNKPSHAYIFSGPAGVGRQLTAVNFAKALNCGMEEALRPCDTCQSCRKIDSFNHPDIFIVKAEKEGATIKIDDIRELIKDVALKPYEAKMKVYIVDGADSMTHEAQNALLKTLEEPVSDSVLILISRSPDLLLPTIVSRAQLVRFFPIKAPDLEEILAKRHGIDETRARILSRLSSGSAREALRYEKGSFLERRLKIINALRDKTFFELDFDRFSKFDLKLSLDIILTWYRDILVAKSGSKDYAGELINIDRREDIFKEADSLDFKYLDEVLKQVILTSSFLAENANPKLAMNVLSLHLQGDICTK